MPEKPPQNLRAWNASSTSLIVSWDVVPTGYVHGVLLGYRVFHKKKKESSFVSSVVNAKSLTVTLRGLKKFTFYTVKILAFTRIGDGASSGDVNVRTDQDGK